jgi:hypothetical protein
MQDTVHGAKRGTSNDDSELPGSRRQHVSILERSSKPDGIGGPALAATLNFGRVADKRRNAAGVLYNRLAHRRPKGRRNRHQQQ